MIAALTGLCVLAANSRASAGQQAQISRVAPLFVHGEGGGGFGCLVVNPPVFLSEDEARKVITDEARKAGITFAPDTQTLPRVPVPITDRYGWDDKVRGKTRYRPLGLDGTDRRRRIGYEFLSDTDFNKWEREDYKYRITIYGYDFQGAAKSLRDGLARTKPKGSYGVFYSPCVTPSRTQLKGSEGKPDFETYRKRREENDEVARQKAKELLGMQVRDFIKWLKAQGVI